MFEWIGLGLVFGILRSAHGEGELPRIVSIGAMTILVCLFYLLQWYVWPLVFGGFCLGLMPGWGKYMTATGLGVWNKNEIEIKPIDFIINKIDHPLWSPVLGMSLRWFIFFFPLFMVLGRPLESFGLLSMGFVYAGYRLLGRNYDDQKWFLMEFITGVILGILVFI